jgi:hypothetical protein
MFYLQRLYSDECDGHMTASRGESRKKWLWSISGHYPSIHLDRFEKLQNKNSGRTAGSNVETYSVSVLVTCD